MNKNFPHAHYSTYTILNYKRNGIGVEFCSSSLGMKLFAHRSKRTFQLMRFRPSRELPLDPLYFDEEFFAHHHLDAVARLPRVGGASRPKAGVDVAL